MSFSPEEVERYARHLVLREVGGPGPQRLRAARVRVVGAGGLAAMRRHALLAAALLALAAPAAAQAPAFRTPYALSPQDRASAERAADYLQSLATVSARFEQTAPRSRPRR